jgi:hypothetical protein
MLVSLCAAAAVMGVVAPDATAACSVAKSTAYDDPANFATPAAVDSGQTKGQSFTLSAPVTLTTISLALRNDVDNTDSITVEIRADDFGAPGALLGTRTLRLADTTTVAFRDFNFSSDRIALAADTTYHIVASDPVPAPNGYGWAYDATSPTYAQGTAEQKSGATWSARPGEDMLFRVFGQTCVPDPPAPVPDLVKPVLSVALSRTVFRAAGSGPATAARKKPVGTRISYSLSEPSSVTFTVERRNKGRKVARKCVRPRRSNRRKKACTRWVKVKGSFGATGRAGTNTLLFRGRIGGRKLAPGRYRLDGRATDPAKNASVVRRRNFRVVR